ncbi:uncharacterized protein LOC129246044 [Anastrepha obliqua]|uniref:uncharacterized protein LOC129246044 n=1 Tax=Anastrepha obliqua TaxID=95512 RepID=UPI00240A133C|nr:uncharacterized protein LOC129246044 [Anastrepha obliqua]
MLDDLNYLYEMHNEELNQVLENVTTYLLKCSKVFHKIRKNEHALQDRSAIALLAYDKFFSTLSNMLATARTFNFHLFITDLEKTSTHKLFDALDPYDRREEDVNTPEAHTDESRILPLDSSTNSTIYCKNNAYEKLNIRQKETTPSSNEENCSNYKNVSIPPAGGNVDADLKEHSSMAYIKKDISKYKVGDLLKASVTYVQDLESLNFYVLSVCDAKSKEFRQIVNLKSMIHLRQFAAIPPENEVFGLVLDNAILRAIRESSSKLSSPPDGKCNAFLLDFGEISEISASNVTYRLPEEIKNIPAQAIPCQLNGIHGQTNLPLEELKTCLLDLVYETTTFLVKSKQENDSKLVLELYKDKIEKSDDLSAPPKKSTDSDLVTLNNEMKLTKKAINTNPFLTDTETSIDDNDEAIPLRALPDNTLLTGESERLFNGLTAEEMDMLTEEPLSTSNAMTAVLGYNPKDEQRICRFFNPKTGACFKGANCRQEHTPLQADGWSKDRVPAGTIIDNFSPTTRYPSGLIINITVTHIGQIEYFYGQINDPDNYKEPLIWTDDEIPLCMHLTKPPMMYDLVRARYEDDLWYRAKVVDFDDSGKVFKVFYVDYGNHQNVLLEHLAYCDRSTERLPFQAVLCRVADIMQNPDASDELRDSGVRTLNALLLNHSLDVKVVSHQEDLIVRFIGTQYNSIKKRLISLGCAKQFHSNASNGTT